MAARTNFSTQAQFPAIAKFFRSFHLRYCISPAAQGTFSPRGRGIKRCALCTVRHITGLTSPGKNLSAVTKEILTRVGEKKRERHVRNVTENIFSTSRRNFLSIGSEEKYSARKMIRRVRRVTQASSDEKYIFRFPTKI